MQASKLHEIFHYKTSTKFASCALLVLVADTLFHRHPAGWTYGLFGMLLLLAIGLHNRVMATRASTVAYFAAAGLTLALIEDPNGLALELYSLTTIAASLLTKLNRVNIASQIARYVWSYGFTLWGRLVRDSIILTYIRKRKAKLHGSRRALLRHWLLPVSLSALFIGLFAAANPIITSWINRINWQLVLEYLALPRIAFWLVVASACWGVIRPKFSKHKTNAALRHLPQSQFTLTGLLFNERSIFLSLVLFNGLFLIQNSLDMAFLWSGMTLPEGMTYADYAHQGAYPLMATALLAASFVLIALKPGSTTECMNAIRWLVYAWVGQNIVLVLSSICALLDMWGNIH